MPAVELVDDVAGTDLASRLNVATTSMCPARPPARVSRSLGRVTPASAEVLPRDEVDVDQL